jgi:hypothetical protein
MIGRAFLDPTADPIFPDQPEACQRSGTGVTPAVVPVSQRAADLLLFREQRQRSRQITLAQMDERLDAKGSPQTGLVSDFAGKPLQFTRPLQAVSQPELLPQNQRDVGIAERHRLTPAGFGE